MSKLLIILLIWSTAAALIFTSAVGWSSFLILIMLRWFLNLPMIVATISFPLILLAIKFLISLDAYQLYFLQCSQQTFPGLQDVLKTSSRHVLKTSSTRLQRINFSSSKTSWRRLANVFKTSCEMSSRRLGRQKIVTLKTSWRRLEDMYWRRLGDKQDVYWNICIKPWSTNKSKSVFNKSISHKSLFHQSKVKSKLH